MDISYGLSEETISVLKYLDEDTKKKRLDQLIELNEYIPRGGIIFIGDSIVEQYPINEFLPGMDIHNRGFGGDTMSMMLERLDYTISNNDPRKIFVLVGTNDLKEKCDHKKIVSQLDALIEYTINKPEIYIISVLPINPIAKRGTIDYEMMMTNDKTNEDIISLNYEYREYCDRKGITFIDCYDSFLDDLGNLKEEYTKEGLHLTLKGYEKLTSIIKEYL